jgi:uncharacterized membrane protein YphA (DoxX/SURF4 family)
MNFSTRVFLVLLQLAIGWHLFYEGYWKIQEKSWSSKGYLKNATGPLAPSIRWLAGDPDVTSTESGFVVRDPNEGFLARFEVVPLDPNEAPSDRRLHKHLPPILAQEWQAYFDRFIAHYQLGKPEDKPPPDGQDEHRAQLVKAERNFILSQNETVDWLLKGTKSVKRPHFSGTLDVTLTTPQRLQEYQNKLDEVNKIQSQELSQFGPKVSPRLLKARQEEAGMRKELMDDLNAQTANMQKGLRDVLTYEQKRMSLPPEPAPQEATWNRFDVDGRVERGVEWVAGPKWGWTTVPDLKWIDRIVKWGLLATGVCLMLGLFTRTACVVGSLFLLLFYAAMPPLGLMTGAPSEGHFLVINHNLIEILALMTIAVSQPYFRYGLDVWLHGFTLFRRGRSKTKTAAKDGQRRTTDPVSRTPSQVPVESSNGGVAAGV